MKYFISLFFIVVILNSCGKENKIENENIDFNNFYQIITNKQKVGSIDGIPLKEKTEIEVQYYEPLKGKKIANQIKFYKNQKIDSLKSRFYNLKFKKIKSKKYNGNIELMYCNKKIVEIEFKAITSLSNGMKTLTFKSNNSNKIHFDFENTNYEFPIKGVLCIKIESDTVINGEKIESYYNRYMFVDNNEMTDNLYIKKYEKYF
jgi:hypothetical protein